MLVVLFRQLFLHVVILFTMQSVQQVIFIFGVLGVVLQWKPDGLFDGFFMIPLFILLAFFAMEGTNIAMELLIARLNKSPTLLHCFKPCMTLLPTATLVENVADVAIKWIALWITILVLGWIPLVGEICVAHVWIIAMGKSLVALVAFFHWACNHPDKSQ